MRHLILVILLCLAVQVAAQEDYTITASVDLVQPFVGQQVVYTLRFTVPPNPADPTTTPEFTFTAPDFVGFWRVDGLSSARLEVVEGRQVVVTEINVLLYPETAGTLTIDPAQITLPETVFTDRVEMISEPVEVQVRPLLEGAPEGFNGAVGRFEMTVSVDKQTLSLGEAITLRSRTTGFGNLERIPPPMLPLPKGWRAYPNPAQTAYTAEGGAAERVFEWRLVPDQTGSTEFAPVAFSYFDPISQSYQTVSTQTFTFDVLPGAGGLTELPTFERAAAASVLPLKPVPPSLLNAEGVPWLLWMLPPLGALLVYGGVTYRVYRQQRRVQLRAVSALNRVQTRLQAAKQIDDPAVAFGDIYTAITGYIADKLDLTEAPRPDTVRTLMTEHGIESRLVEQVLYCLATAEEGRYAPAGVVPASPLIARTFETLTSVEQAW